MLRSSIGSRRAAGAIAVFLAASVALAPFDKGLAATVPVAETPPDTQPAQENVGLPITKVVLYTSGVGYFQRAQQVRGDATAQLRFDADQINDVLKSLVVQSTGGGKVGAVTYATAEPAAEVLKGFDVNLSGPFSLTGLLEQLRGRRVTVTIGGEDVTAKVLGVFKQSRPESTHSTEVPVLSLFDKGVVRTLDLADVRSVRVDDPRLQQQIDRALDAIARTAEKGERLMTLHFRGYDKQGSELAHEVRVGYVTQTPVWEATYRLLLPPADTHSDQKPRLQGWAIVTNQTDDDWHNVDLSLVSGRPLSFIQDLAKPLYVSRPVVQPLQYASLQPPVYQAGIGALQRRDEEEKAAAPQELRAVAAAPAGAAMLKNVDRARFGALNPTASVVAAAVASGLGELFQYTIADVSLPRHESAMFPIVNSTIEAEQVSVYDPRVLATHPLYGARLTNTTSLHLLHGPVTVYAGDAYAGDARIETLGPGQKRLISYGIDLDALVNATNGESQNSVVSAKIVNGMLDLARREVLTQKYTIENESDNPKKVIVVHPLHPGWTPVEPAKPLETTDKDYHFQVDVPARDTRKLTVVEQRIDRETLAILPMDVDQLLAYSKTGDISPDVRQALAKAVELKQAVAQIQHEIEQRRQQITRITQDQSRIRQDMAVVDHNSDYYARLLKELNDQETQLNSLDADIQRLQQKHDQEQAELAQYLNGLNLGNDQTAPATQPARD